MRIPIIMDCDPGHDDAIALLMAFASDKLDVRGVTIVGGNQTLEKNTINALKVLSFAGIKTRVAPGASKPLMRKLIVAPEVHGESGLDGPILPEPTYGVCGLSAVELMVDIIESSKEKITLVPTGPLTNIAMLFMAHPKVKDKIERISLMGGSAIGGNWTPAAEFNILVDPEAADIVFNSGIPITMCGLDVTHKAQAYSEDIERIRAMGGKVAVMVAELMDFFALFHWRFGFKGSPLHDPCAVAWLIDPTLITTEHCRVDIETEGEFTTGATVADLRPMKRFNCNADVALDIDRERFIDLLCELLQKYD